MVSNGAKILGAVTSCVVVVIYVVHYQQQRDRNEMHKGVLNDKARVEEKRRKANNSSL